MTHDGREWHEGQIVRLYPGGASDLSHWLDTTMDDPLVQHFATTLYKVVGVQPCDWDTSETVIRVEPDPAAHFKYIDEHDPWFSPDYFEQLSAIELLALEAE